VDVSAGLIFWTLSSGAFTAVSAWIFLRPFQFMRVCARMGGLLAFNWTPLAQYILNNRDELSDSNSEGALAWRRKRPQIRAMAGLGLLVGGSFVVFGLVSLTLESCCSK
jgi:hypothetical protein